MDAYTIIKYPLATEKVIRLMDSDNVLCFVVNKKANRKDIKDAVEKLFKVKVAEVNTLNVKGEIVKTDHDIVEFEYLIGKNDWLKLRGLFTFNDEELRYEINVYGKNAVKHDIICLSYDVYKMRKFKVIGNIEDNKELI